MPPDDCLDCAARPTEGKADPTRPDTASLPRPQAAPPAPGTAEPEPRPVIEVRPREDRAMLGILLVLCATACFCGIDTSGKWLILAGLPALQVVFVRYFGHFLISVAIYLPTEGPRAFRSRRPLWQFLRALFLMMSTVLNFLSLRHLPLTTATTIMFAGPILVTLLSAPILGETVGPRRLAAVGVGFVGVLVVIQPWGASFDPAMLLTLGAMCFTALYMLTTRFLAGQETNAVSQIWSSGIAAAVLAPFVLAGWTWPDSLAGWVVMAAIGAFGVSGHSFVNFAYRYADASLLSPIFYGQLVYATLAGILVFGTMPGPSTLVGAAIIIASGAYIGWREQQIRSRRPAE